MSDPALASGGTRGPRARLALFVALVLAGAAALYAVMDAAERRHLETEFMSLARRDVDSMSSAFEVVEDRLLAIRQLYASSKEVDAGEFETFVSGLPPLTGVQAYEWIPRVRLADRPKVEAAAAAEGLAGFVIRERVAGEIKPAAEREEYAPVRFVWPLAGNEPAVGFDLWSHEARRAALQLARDTGEMVVTPPLTLVQERGTQRGVLVAMPHYKNGAPRSTLAERREHFEGYALVVVRMGDFVEGVIAANHPTAVGITIAVRYVGLPGEDGALYMHSSRAAATAPSLGRLPEGVNYTRRLGPEHGEGADRDAESVLEAIVTPGPAFVQLHSSGVLPAALVGIAVITVLAIALLFLAEGRTRANEDRARLMLASEQSRASVADAANKAKSEFLSAMSHEIRTPMNGVLGMVEVLMQTSLRANQMEMARTIKQSALALLATINEILDFSKIEAGRFELDCDSARLETVFEKACLLLGPMAQKRQVDLTTYIDPELSAPVNTDADRMRQLVINLVGNAIKFSSGLPRYGAVKLSARGVRGSDGRSMLEFSVRDNGIGIEREKLAVVFEPFRQVAGHTARRHEGTGLGLAICRQIVELMGGTIGIESEVDVGTTVTVRVPLEAAGDRQAGEPPLKGLRCVVEGVAAGVDDAIRAYLSDAGAQVVTAADAGASGTRPDCWVVDVGRMPSDDDIDAAIARVAPSLATDGIPGLVVLRGLRRTARPMGPMRSQVDGTLLTRAQVVMAVGRLCGVLNDDAAGVLDGQHPPGEDAPFASVEPSPLRSATILVAEDNEVNQEVIRRQLTLLGYRFEIAGTGTDALRRLGDRTFSLLLTDLHMPMMDGYELAGKVREREAARQSTRMPIIALTANALKSEAERCRAAGMDDYLSKPVTLSDLRTMLERWTGGEGAGRPGPATTAPPSVPEGGDGIRAKFIASLDAAVSEIRSAAAQERWYDAGFHAHRLKSAATAVGAKELSAACATVEIAGLARNGPAVREGLPTLLQHAERERMQSSSGVRV